MTDATGDLRGRAILFGDSRGQQQGRQQSAGGRQQAGASSRAGAELDDIITKPEGVQFDDAGINDAIYQGYGALRNFLVQARAKGFDPTMGPDPSIPGSSEYVAQWHRAVAAYEQILEKGKQGKEYMDMLVEAALDDKILATDDVLSGRTGNLSAEELVRETGVKTPEFITKANALLGVEPTTLQEQKTLEEYYQVQLEAIKEQIDIGTIAPEFENYYISMLRAPRAYNPASDDLNKARIAQAQAQARQARAAAKKTERETKDPVFPELAEMVVNLDKLRSQDPAALNQTNEITSKMYEGRTLGGDPKGPRFDRMEAATNPDGSRAIRMVFKAQDTEDKPDLFNLVIAYQAAGLSAEEALVEAEKIFKGGASQETEIFVTEDNPLAGWFSTLKTSEREDAAKQIGYKDQGFETGELDFEGTRRLLGMEGSPSPEVQSRGGILNPPSQSLQMPARTGRKGPGL